MWREAPSGCGDASFPLKIVEIVRKFGFVELTSSASRFILVYSAQFKEESFKFGYRYPSCQSLPFKFLRIPTPRLSLVSVIPATVEMVETRRS